MARVIIGSDHAGFELKERIKRYLEGIGVELEDKGVFSEQPSDYPDIAYLVAKEVSQRRADFGILVCGTGIGMSIVANKFPGVRAALIYSEYAARMARSHNEANILVIPGRVFSFEYVREILKTFMESSFSGEERHARRVSRIREIEKEILESAFPYFSLLRRFDPEVFSAIVGEIEKQEFMLNLIASENMVSPRVLVALFNPMNNKYAEGYPAKRYYGGCEFVDSVEEIARERVKRLFSAEHANVQPHSGTQANQAVYLACCDAGDKIMAFDLSSGGHLSHGARVNFSGKIYKAVFYTVDRNSHLLDMNEVREIALRERPKVIIAGASSYPRIIDFKAFSEIAKEVGAYFLADIAHPAGLVAGGVFPNPTPYADFVTFTTHKTMRGPRGAVILSRAEHAKKIDSAVFPGSQGGPFMHVIAAKAVCFKEAAQDDFTEYCAQVVRNARALADEFIKLGYRVITGGTDSHIVLIDVSVRGVSGGEVEAALYKAGIILNKNVIPFDPRPPMNPSGIRIGTAAITTRGMDEEATRRIAHLIDRVISSRFDENVMRDVRAEVKEMTNSYPYYRELLEFVRG